MSGAGDLPLPDLTSDCSRCAALCCVALDIDKGPMFALSKPAGAPCPNLSGHRCTIHEHLETRGFRGCVAYDCAGAGQRITQSRFNGESWRDAPEILAAMIRDFGNLRPLHERMTILVAAGEKPLTPSLEDRRRALLKTLARSWSDTDEMKAGFTAFIADLRRHLAA